VSGKKTSASPSSAISASGPSAISATATIATPVGAATDAPR
jgi:hypothetical protein